MSNHAPIPNTTQDSQRFITFINFLLVSGMLSCLAFVTGHFIGIFFPEWTVSGLPVLIFFITLASLIFLYVRTRIHPHGSNPFASTAAEWVLTLLIGKIFLMLQPGAGSFWQELLSWQNGFLLEFFDVQYLLLAFFLFVIWGLTRIISSPLFQLEEDQALMEQEKLGVTFNDRQEARRSLMGLVFFIGFIMVGMVVIIKGNFQSIPVTEIPTRAFVIALLTYFSLGFIFLSLNYYAILKARWYFNDIQVNTDIAKRWLLFTMIFILVVNLLTIFLPTDFAFGFLPVAQTLFKAIVYIFGILQFLIMVPITFFLSLFGSLLGNQESEQISQPEMPEFAPEITQPTTALPWWDMIRSILFWLIFVGVVILAIRYYINNHPGLKDFFTRLRIKAWLAELWKWLKRGLRKVGEAAQETVRKAVQQARNYFSDREVKLPSLKDIIRHLPPRQALILTYLDWVHWNDKYGLKRRKSQTPIEYAEAIHQRWPELDAYLIAFTDDFIAARYTHAAINKEQLEEAQSLLAKMKAVILDRQSLPS